MAPIVLPDTQRYDLCGVQRDCRSGRFPLVCPSSSSWDPHSGLGMSLADAHENKPSDRGALHISGPSKAAKLTLPKQVPQLNPRSKEVGCVFSSGEGTVK